MFPPYEIKTFDGIPVAFIGLTLKGTAGIVSPDGIAGLEFRDEADTVNALVPELRAQGVEAIVVLIHEGGYTVERTADNEVRWKNQHGIEVITVPRSQPSDPDALRVRHRRLGLDIDAATNRNGAGDRMELALAADAILAIAS